MQADAGTSRHTQVPVGTRRYQQAHAGRIIGRRLLPILPDKSKYRGRTSVFGVVVAASHVTESDMLNPVPNELAVALCTPQPALKGVSGPQS